MFICDKANFFVYGKILYTANCSLHSPLFFRKILGHLRKNKRLWIVYCTIVYTSHLLAVSFYCLLAKQENMWMLTGLKPKTTLINTLRAEATFLLCELSCEKWSLFTERCYNRSLWTELASFRPFVHRSFQTAEPRKDLWYLNLLDSHVIQVVR